MRVLSVFVLALFLASCSSVPTSSLEQKRSELEKIINTGINGEKAKVTVNGNTIRAQISNQILFDFDKYQVKKPFQTRINRLALFLRNNPEMTLVVEGHTDKTGKKAYNKTLSIKRANAVKSSFSRYGVADNRVRAIGYGEERPLHRASNKQNRRVEIIFQEKRTAINQDTNSLSNTISGAEEKMKGFFSGLKEKSNKSGIQPFSINAGFNPNNVPSPRNKRVSNWSLSAIVSPNKILHIVDVPVLIRGASKDKKAHTVELEITVSIPVYTKRYGCIIGTCSENENIKKTETEKVTLEIPANSMGEETTELNILLGESLSNEASSLGQLH